jgi:ADP-ribosylglycohydrolase
MAKIQGLNAQSARDWIPCRRHRYKSCVIASYEDAIWSATSQDGDRDTLGAIVGGIVVLATGVEGIPILWRAATEPIPSLFGP